MLIITVDVQLDTNKDEFLSLEELTADSEKEWTEEETEEMKRIDTDEDELLSRDELFSYISKELDDRDNTEEIDGEEPEDNEKILDTFFETQDLDKDGVISYEEFQAKHDEL